MVSSFSIAARRFAPGAVVALAMACDSSDSSAVRFRSCDEICAHYEVCDDSTDETGCQDRCKAEAFRSDEYFIAKAECATSLSCNRLIEQDDAEDLTDCIRRTLRAGDANEVAQSLCSGLGNKLADCDSRLMREVVSSQCEPIAVTLSEEYATASQGCLNEACANVGNCLENLADDYSTAVKIYDAEVEFND